MTAIFVEGAVNAAIEAPPAQPAPSPEPVIRLDAVSVKYRLPRERIRTFKEYAIRRLRGEAVAHDFWALRGVSMTARRGEALAIVGANGAGKSTLLKLVARVLRPSAGRVRVQGNVVPLLEVSAGFHPELTGRENVYLNATLLGHGRAQIDERFHDIVEFAGLWDFIDAPLRTYSTGMIARLGFAVAMAWPSDILILDEVLAVGDEAFRRKCRTHLDAIRERGATILQVSHDLAQVRAMCDRAIWLDHGEIRLEGSADEVTAKYEAAMQRDTPSAVTIVLPAPKAGVGGPEPGAWLDHEAASDERSTAEPVAAKTNGQDYTDHWRADRLANLIPHSPRFGCFPEGWNAVDFLRRYAGPLAGSRVVDLGCGTGRLCEAFAPTSYLGLDINEDAVARARADHPGYSFERVDFVGDYPPADLYLAYMVLMYVDDASVAAMLERLCGAAPRILIADIFDREWRQGAYHPAFNRTQDDYERLMTEHRFVLEEQIDKSYAYFPGSHLSFLSFRRRVPPPPAISRFPEDLAAPDLEVQGLHDDGWLAASAAVTLSRPQEAATLVVRLVVPDLGDRAYSTGIAVSVDGHELATETLYPGEFELRCPLHGADGPREVGLVFSATQRLPAPDNRDVAGRLMHLGFAHSDPPGA
jgi:ABC-type polysaccharide/polyol phosphate transport system ATPase subunit/SAM-dependent methyltransferase